jgi:hypothetical protein
VTEKPPNNKSREKTNKQTPSVKQNTNMYKPFVRSSQCKKAGEQPGSDMQNSALPNVS